MMIYNNRMTNASLQTIKLKADELTGPALTWAAIRALGFAPHIEAAGIGYKSNHGSWVYPDFEDPAEAAQMAEREWISLERPSRGQKTPMWRAITDEKGRKLGPGECRLGVVDAWALTSYLAIARVFIVSRLGPFIDVPSELVD